MSTAPVVYNQQVEIRQLLIDWVTANHTIDPAQFASVDWKLVVERQPNHDHADRGRGHALEVAHRARASVARQIAK